MLTVLVTTVVVSAIWGVIYKYGVGKVKAEMLSLEGSVERTIKDKL